MALRLAMAVCMTAIVLWYADGSEVLARLRDMDLRFFALACALLMLGQVLNAWRWRLLLQRVTPEPPPVRYLWVLVLVGMFFSFILPTTVGGDVVRAEMVKSRVGGRSNAYSSIVVARLLGLLSVLVLGALAVGAAYALVGWYDRELILAWTVVVLPVLAFAAWMLKGLALGAWVARLPAQAGAALGRVRSALAAYASRPAVLWQVLSVAIAANALGTIGVVWALADGLAMTALPVHFHFIAVPLAMLVAMAPVSINGIGLREGAFVYLYAKAGVGAAVAVSLSLAFTAVLALCSLLGGAFLLLPRQAWPGTTAPPLRRADRAPRARE